MKKLPPFAAALILVIAGALFVFLKKTDDTIIIRSDDGEAELRIPKDAVLEGGTIKDITMTAIAPEDIFKESDQPTDAVKIYRLEPDGLTFSKPATLSATFPYDPGKNYFPIIMVHSDKDDTVENLAIADLKVDEEKKSLTLSGEVRHFSDYFLNIDSHIFTARHIPEGEITVPVGGSFEHTYLITVESWEYSLYPHYPDPDHKHDVRVEVGKDGRWVVQPGSMVALRSLEPKQVALEKRELGIGQEYRVVTTFTCRSVGVAHPVIVEGTKIDYALRSTTGVKTAEPKTTEFDRLGFLVSYWDSLKVNCVAPSGTDAPSGDARGGEENSATAAPPAPPATGGGAKIKICGLPGGEPCPTR